MVDFLVIGSYNIVTYKNTFPLIKDRIIRIGWNRIGEFSDGSRFGNIVWFSTVGGGIPPELLLKKDCDIDNLDRFDNYDAININKIEEIPDGYYGEIGVPVTFLERWNPEQFELIGLLTDNKGDGEYFFNGTKTYVDEKHRNRKSGVVNGKMLFDKLLIKKKN